MSIKDWRIENAIYHTLVSFGMRLPVQHEGAGIGERIELMQIMAGRIAKVVKELDHAN